MKLYNVASKSWLFTSCNVLDCDLDWSDPVYKYWSPFEKHAQQMPFRTDVG